MNSVKDHVTFDQWQPDADVVDPNRAVPILIKNYDEARVPPSEKARPTSHRDPLENPSIDAELGRCRDDQPTTATWDEYLGCHGEFAASMSNKEKATLAVTTALEVLATRSGRPEVARNGSSVDNITSSTNAKE